MATRYLCVLCLAASAFAPDALAKDRIRISIKNEYVAKVDFGMLGKVSRDGSDKAEGLLELQGDEYVGVVTAEVGSNQTTVGLGGIGNCGPGRYDNSQQLQVTGRRVGSFNTDVQSVTPNQAASTGSPSAEYLLLEFAPVPGVDLQPPNPDPGMDQVIACHTIIETEAGRFLPFNDSRWTMKGGGYIVNLPTSGAIDYTDATVPAAGAGIGPFNAEKSTWSIRIERLP
jgi:hypothetical protein